MDHLDAAHEAAGCTIHVRDRDEDEVVRRGHEALGLGATRRPVERC
jgi:hypothetical protein